ERMIKVIIPSDRNIHEQRTRLLRSCRRLRYAGAYKEHRKNSRLMNPRNNFPKGSSTSQRLNDVTSLRPSASITSQRCTAAPGGSSQGRQRFERTENNTPE